MRAGNRRPGRGRVTGQVDVLPHGAQNAETRVKACARWQMRACMQQAWRPASASFRHALSDSWPRHHHMASSFRRESWPCTHRRIALNTGARRPVAPCHPRKCRRAWQGRPDRVSRWRGPLLWMEIRARGRISKGFRVQSRRGTRWVHRQGDETQR